MNPYRQIDRLEKKVKKLEDENKQLRDALKANEHDVAMANAKQKAAEECEGEYYKMIEELRKCKDEYDELTKALRLTLKDVYKASKKIT